MSEDTYLSVLIRHFDKPERLPALFSIHKKLNDEEFWQCFHAIWTNTESAFRFNREIRAMLTKRRLASPYRLSTMDDEGRNFIAKKITDNAPLRIWRGCRRENQHGYSWTTDRDKAVWFACRFGASKPLLIEGTISPEKIVAVYTERNENEIFVFPHDVVKLCSTKLQAQREPNSLDILTFKIQAFGYDFFDDFKRDEMILKLNPNDCDQVIRSLEQSAHILLKFGFVEKADHFRERIRRLIANRPSYIIEKNSYTPAT